MALLGKLEEVVGGVNEVNIHQKFSLAEALTQGMCEVSNMYGVFTGAAGKDAKPTLIAKEKSDCCTRACCAPGHSTFIEVDTHQGADSETLFTLERPGCTALPCSAPKPCLNCCACTDACTEEVTMHMGKVEGKVGDVSGGGNPFLTIKQETCMTSMFHPKLDVKMEGQSDNLFTVTGPFCFGGCSELCFESRFSAMSKKTNRDVGFLRKLAPASLGECCKEMCTDADKFRLSYEDGASVEDKSALMGVAFLADYMFFEQDNGMCTCTNEGIVLTLWQCYCCGCVVPCNLKLQSSKGE